MGFPSISEILVRAFLKSKKIQKYFTRRLYSRIYPRQPIPKYNERLSLFKMFPLEATCVMNELLLLFKIINIIIDIPFSPTFSTLKPTRFVFQSSVSTTYRNCYFHRSLVSWNKFVSTRKNLSFSATEYSSFRQFLIDQLSHFVPGSAS